MLAGFGLLGALSARGVSRPFDVDRDGFVLGEGAAMVVLTRDRGDSATAVLGIARTLDGGRLTAPDSEGRGAERAMRLALEDAGLETVDYVQAHGTSTPLNDAVEAAAIARVLGPKLDSARVSSVKGALGHWIAGAGALGLLCAHQAIVSQRVPPTVGLEMSDPSCALPHVMHRSSAANVNTALASAFAFGGANCSLVLGRLE
jgi:3-oxoacyl-(acyl-carrier-protein) synthase